ncbi:hypothetical protein ACK3YO_18445 [Aeromonas caviae]
MTKVCDLTRSNSDFIFILESPHTNELASKYPAAGASGVTMSQSLDLGDSPKGALISGGKIEKISLINACQTPLADRYAPKDREWRELIKIKQADCKKNLPKIKASIKDIVKSPLGQTLVADFQSRLQLCISGSPNAKNNSLRCNCSMFF